MLSVHLLRKLLVCRLFSRNYENSRLLGHKSGSRFGGGPRDRKCTCLNDSTKDREPLVSRPSLCWAVFSQKCWNFLSGGHSILSGAQRVLGYRPFKGSLQKVVSYRPFRKLELCRAVLQGRRMY